MRPLCSSGDTLGLCNTAPRAEPCNVIYVAFLQQSYIAQLCYRVVMFLMLNVQKVTIGRGLSVKKDLKYPGMEQFWN